MAELFTAIEYAVLAHLRAEGRSTIPAMAASLLLPLDETEEAVSRLVTRGLMHKGEDIYYLGPLAMEIPIVKIEKTSFSPLAPAPGAPVPDVNKVFKQARERAQREKAGGEI